MIPMAKNTIILLATTKYPQFFVVMYLKTCEFFFKENLYHYTILVLLLRFINHNLSFQFFQYYYVLLMLRTHTHV